MEDIEKIKKEYEELLNKISDPGLLNSEGNTGRRASGSLNPGGIARCLHTAGSKAPDSRNSGWDKFDELSKRKNALEKIIEKTTELEDVQKKIAEDKAILNAGEDPALVSLAENELSNLVLQEGKLKKEIKDLISGGSEEGSKSVIIEIRAGTGGEEAALFANDLFRMYSKYAQSQNWKLKVLDSRFSELNGLKEIIFEVSGEKVFTKMQHEGGVHRVQRIPETEKAGRIHTSTVTVAILARPKKTQMQIKPSDLKVDFYRASGPGGQNVNRRETAVRITHLPTGIVVTSQTERNQLQNKENAMAILEAKVLEKKETEAQEGQHGKRNSQIGGAKRAEKIRTYNFPQNRLTDHRIKKSWKNLEEIFEGNLDPVIKNLRDSV